jgi:hypothetical protein
MTSLVLLFVACGVWASAQQPDPLADFRQALHKLADFSPEFCDPPDPKGEYPEKVEESVFSMAEDVALKALNAPSEGAGLPEERAEQAMKQLEQLSAGINARWPEENRLHFQVLDLPPALVVKVSFRVHDRFFVFAVPDEASGKPNRQWRRVGSDNDFRQHIPFPPQVDLFPIHRGPSGNARFLARFFYSGCAGSMGISYAAGEWDPTGNGYFEEIIHQDGSLGLDDKVEDFPQIGHLQTEGPLITLPYCWFSPIDTWDNPSLCAVDTYDLSGDDAGFQSRAYNRPDLVPIAKVLEYSEKHDYPAVRSYCASSQVAQKLVRVPPHHPEIDLRVVQAGDGKERVEFGDSRFDVEKRNGRWLVVAFSAE